MLPGDESHHLAGAGEPGRQDQVPDEEATQGNPPFVHDQVPYLAMHLLQ